MMEYKQAEGFAATEIDAGTGEQPGGKPKQTGGSAQGGRVIAGRAEGSNVSGMNRPHAALLDVEEAELGPMPDPSHGHYLFDNNDLRAAINDDLDGDAEASSPEEGRRIAALRQLASDPDVLWRPHLVADSAMVARLEALRIAAPNAREAIDIVLRAAVLSRATGAPIDVPPLLLLGPPGCGKTYLARALARALDAPSEMLLGSTMADATPITGAGVSWRGAGPGRLAQLLLRAPTSAPMMVVDEVEKIVLWNRREAGADILLGLLDRDMAAAHEDAWYRVRMAAGRVTWILAANHLDGLSDPLLDRVVVLEIGAPSRKERHGILQRVYAEVRARLGLDPSVALDHDVADRLVDISLRRIGPTLQLALGYAVAAGRDHIDADDLARASALVARGRGAARRPIGFGAAL